MLFNNLPFLRVKKFHKHVCKYLDVNDFLNILNMCIDYETRVPNYMTHVKIHIKLRLMIHKICLLKQKTQIVPKRTYLSVDISCYPC